MDDLGTIFSLNNWPGHLSYLLIAISYWLTDMFWLRTVAVVGLSLEILYFWHSGGDLRTGIGWDLVFIAINLYQLYRLMKDRLSLRLPEAERDLLRSAFTGLDDSQIVASARRRRVCRSCRRDDVAEENQALDKIFFICSGRVAVTIAGRAVSHVERGSFIGEVAFLTDTPATATVIADGDVRALAFERAKLKDFFDNEEEVAGLIYQLLGRELAGKIKVSNRLLSAGNA